MWLGLVSVTAILVGGVIWVAVAARSSPSGLASVLTWLPVGLVFAAVNAAQEELRFRVVPLAALVPAVGAESAMWMTAAVFGLAHWSQATPSGPSGLIYHGLIGAWLAKSILETRGVAWAWTIHTVADLVLFVVLVLEVS
jgi:hypothetical protein